MWTLETSRASVIPATQEEQHFPVVTLGVLLDVVVQGLAILSLECRPNFQHVHFTAGDHSSGQVLISSPLALHGAQSVSKMHGLVLATLDPVQESIFQGSLDLLDAFQHVMRAGALVPFKHFLEVTHHWVMMLIYLGT